MKLTLLTLWLYFYTSNAYTNDSSINGQWVVASGDAVVEIYTSDTLQIDIVSTLDPTLNDKKNPDKKLKERLLTGITLGQGFKPNKQGWSGGRLYDPGSGKTYRAKLHLIEANKLKVHGYIGMPALGRSQIWLRKDTFTKQIKSMLSTDAFTQDNFDAKQEVTAHD